MNMLKAVLGTIIAIPTSLILTLTIRYTMKSILNNVEIYYTNVAQIFTWSMSFIVIFAVIMTGIKFMNKKKVKY